MSGHVTDLAMLYDAEHGRLRRFLIQRGLLAVVAADAIQEAFLRLFRSPTINVLMIKLELNHRFSSR